MTLLFPKKLFHTPIDLEDLWSVLHSDLVQWMIEGELIAAVWLPIMSVIGLAIAENADPPHLEHWEGYIRLSGPQCRRLFRYGWISIREFLNLDGSRSFRLPETKDDIAIYPDDLVILESERRRFEGRYPALVEQERILPKERHPNTYQAKQEHDPTFRVIHMEGQMHRFGEIQAKVIRLLAEASAKGEPWQSGKTLLREAGSESFSVSNLFKRHPVWRRLIQSDGRGFYRLHQYFARSVEETGGEIQSHVPHQAEKP